MRVATSPEHNDGGTPYGFGQQIIEDTVGLTDYLDYKEHLWAAMLGNLVHSTCHARLVGAGRLLRLFEALADRAAEKERYLEWYSPVTNFPVVQAYRQPVSARTKLRLGDIEMHVVVENWEEATLDKDAQRLGSSPNFVHSLDAVHLSMCVHDSPFPVTVVHDSFGCNAGSMDQMFYLVRQKFVELYDGDPLRNILKQLDCEDLYPEQGNLDISQVLHSDYAFL